MAFFLPLLAIGGGLGAAAYFGGEAVEGAIEKTTEATADVGVAVVKGAYGATKDAIAKHTSEFFMAITVMALAWGAVEYSRALLTKP